MSDTKTPAAVTEIIQTMDGVIGVYQHQNRKVERLVLSAKQWQVLSDWHDKLLKAGGTPTNGIVYDAQTKGPYYRGYRLEKSP